MRSIIFGTKNAKLIPAATIVMMKHHDDLRMDPAICSRYHLPDMHLCDSERLFQSPKTVSGISNKANITKSKHDLHIRFLLISVISKSFNNLYKVVRYISCCYIANTFKNYSFRFPFISLTT